jgi:hypothetical protein
MGSLIGILSTVILVSTVCTLIFAVGAYVLARSNRDGVNIMEDGEMPGEDLMEDQFPHRDDSPIHAGNDTSLFKRMQPTAGRSQIKSDADDEFQWK